MVAVNRPVWRCPAPNYLDDDIAKTARCLFGHIATASIENDFLISSVGLELRMAMGFIGSRAHSIAADNDFWEAKCRKLLLRPAVEPLAISYWPRFSSFHFDKESALRLASAAAGRSIAYREKTMVGRSRTGDVEFESVDDSALWLAKLLIVSRSEKMDVLLPIFAFAQVIFAHPFSDANGRVARLMIHAALAAKFRLAAPVVAIAPTFYRRAETLKSALNHLSYSHCWNTFARVFIGVMEEATDTSLKLYRK